MGSETNKHTVKQHYVPRAFLEKWCKDGQFFPIKASDVNPEETQILKKTGAYPFCFENYFYANERGKKDDFSQEVEGLMTKIENKMYGILDDFEDKVLNNKPISYKDKHILSEVMHFFDVRGKRGFERSDNLVQQLFDRFSKEEGMSNDAILKLIGATEEEIIIKDGKVEMGTSQHIRQLWSVNDHMHHISNKDWMISISRDGEFIVTDTPYLDISKEYRGVLSNNIYDRTQIFILSPRVLIFIKKPLTMTNVRNYLFDETKPLSDNKCYLFDVTTDKKRVDILNATLFDYSIMFGFHHSIDVLERLKSCLIELAKQNQETSTSV